MDGWTDLSEDGGVWVSALFSSLCFLKGGDGEAEAQTQASLSALKGCWAWWRKDTLTGREREGHTGLYGTPQCHTEHSDPLFMETLQEGAKENTAYPQPPRRRRREWLVMISNSLITSWKEFGRQWCHWHIRKDLLHIEHVLVNGSPAQFSLIQCMIIIRYSVVKHPMSLYDLWPPIET